MQAIVVFPLVLWESVKSIMFSEVAFTSLESSCLPRTLFLCGRKADSSTELALSSRLVTFLVAKFPWSIWDARIFDMTRIKIWVDWILVKSWCLSNSNVIHKRSANWLAQAAQGWFRTTCIPFNGTAGVILLPMLPRYQCPHACEIASAWRCLFWPQILCRPWPEDEALLAWSVGSESWSNCLRTKLK